MRKRVLLGCPTLLAEKAADKEPISVATDGSGISGTARDKTAVNYAKISEGIQRGDSPTRLRTAEFERATKDTEGSQRRISVNRTVV
jgi:hypothetical protein